MGNCNYKVDKYDPTTDLQRNQFHFSYVIGKGGFGKVWKVFHKKTKKQFAMKEMQKVRVVNKRSVNSVMNEMKLLSMMKHPFIVNIHYAFQDRENLYLAMDLMLGGDLRYHICKRKRFTENETKFFAACIVTGLEYIHSNAVIHRDIKPENLVFDTKGYLRITDFGIARIMQQDNSSETSGTPGYMAPEVISRQNHTFSADFFAVGVIIYEIIIGKRPYVGKSRKEIRDAIMAKQATVSYEELPQDWSRDAADFVNGLLQRKPTYRLGHSGVYQIKSHPWFRNFPWTKLSERALPAVYIPPKADNFDARQVMSNWKDEIQEESIRQASSPNLFNGYFYDRTIPQDNLSTISNLK
jgi:serine/threonine protein kinase